MICTIDPSNPDAYTSRTFGVQLPNDFYTRLFDEAGIQVTNAHFTSISLSNGVATLSLDHLTFGATNLLERLSDLGQTNTWTPVTNFISLSRTSTLADPLVPGSTTVLYRLTVLQ